VSAISDYLNFICRGVANIANTDYDVIRMSH